MDTPPCIVAISWPGPGWSKLMKSLVNKMLNFQTYYMQICYHYITTFDLYVLEDLWNP